METGDKFSFPIFPLLEEEDHDEHRVGFEFGGSPSPIDSPADHLFFNGRLLPHAFPSQVPMINNTFYSLSRSTSVTSSKDYSFVSSRSNSRSSSCSSARTSVSTTDSASSTASYERKLFVPHHRQRHRPKVLSGSASRRSVTTSSLSSPHYGSQFIITPPALILKKKKRKKEEEGKCGSRARKANKTWFWRRFFRSFVSACKECHAINPSSPTKYPPN